MKPAKLPAPPWGTQALVVLVDGPKSGAWYFATDWDQHQRAEAYMGRAVAYAKTTQKKAHPDVDAVGTVWRFDDALAERAHSADVARGVAAGVAGRTLATRRNSAAHERGMEILRRAALRHAMISADTIREELEAAEVPGQARAGLWTAAKARQWIRKVDSRPSGGESAHGKPIDVYESLLHVAQAAS